MAPSLRHLPVAAFVAVVLLPVVFFGFDIGTSDYARGKFPSSLSRKTPREIDNWLSTNLGYRDLRMRIGALVQFGALRRSTSSWITVGSDGWLFVADSGNLSGPPPRVEDFRGSMRLPPATIARINDNLRMARNQLARCNISLLVFVAPNKQSIYGEYLANAGWPTETRLSHLIRNASAEVRAMLLDPRDLMLKYKAAHRDLLLYNKTGSHWTDLGALLAYNQIVDRLHEDRNVFAPERAALNGFDFTATHIRGENMDAIVTFAKEMFSDLDVRLSPKIPQEQISMKALPPYNQALTREYTNPEGKQRLVFLGDSFGVRPYSPIDASEEGRPPRTDLVPLLARNFETVVYTQYPYLFGDFIAKHRPDVIILETVERNLEILSEPPRNLDLVCPPR